MKEILKEQSQAISITDKGIIAKLEYENKFLRDSLKVSSIIVSILTPILTTIILVNILG